MLTSVIYLLIYACILALAVYAVIWVLRDVIGLVIPARIIQILWVIVALIVLLWLVQMLLGGGLQLPKLSQNQVHPAALTLGAV